ncbi:unnamed protein product [Clonostachys rhizophaga]|uniref:ER-bound oxygenase mpaB/mpaB'/Rubber oxygenase catalytic domain-containing protein n=1 Tax=Clonostachys rhizophaga TaxID=160324 RepID=A0A9N9V470_9HYPO|nr:unnamed protein product [Clonostachys rhizophaga]
MEAMNRTISSSLGTAFEQINRVTDTLGIPQSAFASLTNFTWKSKKGAAAIILGYLLLVRALRFRRENAAKRKFKFTDRASLARMTSAEAQLILKYLATLEMPQLQFLSLQFGLFKTYGVESISKLLVATRNLADPKNSPKRYEDTAVIINEFMAWDPSAERTVKAIARMNFLHSKYIASGKISNDDLLYTLSVFVIEPARFAERYDWRPFNDMEYCALGVFWKSIGDAMGINYHGSLPGAENGWKDGIQFADELTAWANAYEIAQMRPNSLSPKPAHALLPIITYWIPWFAKPFVTECVLSLINTRILEAFKLPEPSITAVAVTHGALVARRFVIRHLMLPRIFEIKILGEQDPSTGRYLLPQSHGNWPFYVKPTLWNRWGPVAWAIRLYGGYVPGNKPAEFMPQGYTFEDVGPVNRANQGKEEMEADLKRLRASKRSGCPF